MTTDSRGPTGRASYASFTYYERLVAAGGEPTVSDAMSAALAQNWWAIALRGAFAILFGLVALLLPEVTMLALVLLFAAYMLLDGIFAIIAGVRAARRHDRWGWLIFEGAVNLIAGVIAVVWPFVTIVAFVFLLGAWAIVSGALLLAASFRLLQRGAFARGERPAPYRPWQMVDGARRRHFGDMGCSDDHLAAHRGIGTDMVAGGLRPILRRRAVVPRLSAAQPARRRAVGDAP